MEHFFIIGSLDDREVKPGPQSGEVDYSMIYVENLLPFDRGCLV